MSQVMDLIDEARADRDLAINQAAQWQYVATLLFLQSGSPVQTIPEQARDIGAYYIEVNEDEDDDGALSITLREGESNA